MMSDVYSDAAERTLPMTVANTGFMLDRLGRDCAPLQFLRELTQNAFEAVQALPKATGDVIWDVDWDYLALTDVYKLSVIDTGVGMTGDEMVTYINQLSSSVHEQSHEGNFGVGAKIAAATRNHEGLIYLSWKAGVGSMIHIWRSPSTGEYGLRQFERPDGTFAHYANVEDSLKPEQIGEHGTKVVLLGNSADQNTMLPPEGTATPSRWIARYLNTRYFQIPSGVTVRAREGWENPRTDGDRNLLRKVTGEKEYLDSHAEASGTVPLTNGNAHWWILKNEKALTQNSGYIASSGHSAALYQDELYELATGRAGVARLQLFGIIFGYQRVVLYLEPASDDAAADLTTNTARTQLIFKGDQLPWAEWAAEFRENKPKEIEALEEAVSAGTPRSDHRQAIRERLRQIRELLRPSRYRPTPKGTLLIDDEARSGGAARTKTRRDESSSSGGSRPRASRAGNVYGLFLSANGEPGEAVTSLLDPEVDWISAVDPKCKPREPGFLEDRAAKYLPEQNLLLINADFRVFSDMIDRWCEKYGQVAGARDAVTDVVREWFEQGLVETVLGVQGLTGSREWSFDEIKMCLSEESLTTAAMQRYHVDMAVRRGLGAKLGTLKEKAS
jgi:hypothetical protein